MSKASDKYEEKKVSNGRKKPSLLLYVLNLSSLNEFSFIKKYKHGSSWMCLLRDVRIKMNWVGKRGGLKEVMALN